MGGNLKKKTLSLRGLAQIIEANELKLIPYQIQSCRYG